MDMRSNKVIKYTVLTLLMASAGLSSQSFGGSPAGTDGAINPTSGLPPILGTNILKNNSITVATSYVTAAISPTANNLDIVSVMNKCSAACATLVPTVTGAGGTWTQIGLKRSADNQKIVTMFRDMSGSPGSGALTIDFGGVNQDSVGWSVDEFSGIDTSGTHGSGAIVQFVGNTQQVAATSLTCTLAALGSTSNAAYGAFRASNSQAITDNLTNLSYQSNTNVAYDVQRGVNSTTPTWTYASTAATQTCAAVEIKNGV